MHGISVSFYQHLTLNIHFGEGFHPLGVSTIEVLLYSVISGVVQGSEPAVKTMKSWLRETGSPKSRIDSCIFTNLRGISSTEFKDFQIHRKPRF